MTTQNKIKNIEHVQFFVEFYDTDDNIYKDLSAAKSLI